MSKHPYQDGRKQFEADVNAHQMAILHDDGLYRHLRFKDPKCSIYWFDIITSPGLLTINGDMGTYVFARITDMFDFFTSNTTHINPGYWGQKLQADSGYKNYSPIRLKELVESTVSEHAGELAAPESAAFRQEVLTTLWEWGEPSDDETEARQDLDQFEHNGFRFKNAWEWDLRDYQFRYLWCCFAIQWGILRYRAQVAA